MRSAAHHGTHSAQSAAAATDAAASPDAAAAATASTEAAAPAALHAASDATALASSSAVASSSSAAAAAPAAAAAATSSAAASSSAASSVAASSMSAAASAASSSSSSSLPLPALNATYKLKEYWDERFKVESSYEWLSGYDSFRSLLLPYLRKEDRILHLGCGNSDLGRALYLDGFTSIVNLDFSAECIEAQRVRNVDCPEMSWVVGDMLALAAQFAPGSFDIVLDKCALDALVVDEGDPWDPKPAVREQVAQVLRGVSTVLRPDGGSYLQLSFGQPLHRLTNYFDREEYAWEVDPVQTWGAERGFGYFFYSMHRRNDEQGLKRIREHHARKSAVAAEEAARLAAYEAQQREAHANDSDEDRDGGMMFAVEW